MNVHVLYVFEDKTSKKKFPSVCLSVWLYVRTWTFAYLYTIYCLYYSFTVNFLYTVYLFLLIYLNLVIIYCIISSVIVYFLFLALRYSHHLINMYQSINQSISLSLSFSLFFVISSLKGSKQLDKPSVLLTLLLFPFLCPPLPLLRIFTRSAS